MTKPECAIHKAHTHVHKRMNNAKHVSIIYTFYVPGKKKNKEVNPEMLNTVNIYIYIYISGGQSCTSQ